MNHPDLDTWNDGEEDARAAADEYWWMVEHEKTCPRTVEILIPTYPGSERLATVRCCQECRYILENHPFPPSPDLPF